MFFLVCQNCERKKMLSNTCNELTFISYFGKCEYDYCFNMLQEHDNNILSVNDNIYKSVSHFLFDQIVSYCLGKKTLKEIVYRAILDYPLRYIRSQSGRKLNPGATHVYSCDLNLRTNCFSIVSFRLYTWETCHSRHDIGKVWQTWGYKFASINHFNSDIAMLYIDQTPVKIGI